MSISAFQEKFLQKGCGTIIGVACALVMGMFVFQTCGQQQQMRQMEDQKARANTLAIVGGQPIDMRLIDNAVNEQTTQQISRLISSGQEPPSKLPLAMVANMHLGAVTQVVRSQLMTVIAQQNGIKLDDATLIAEIDRQLAELKKQTRDELLKAKTIKPTDDDTKVDEQIKQRLGGQSPDEVRKNLVENILKDPAKRPALVMGIAQGLLGKQLEEKNKPTDAELEATYKTLVVKKIVFRNDAKGKAPAAERAEKALAEIKAGADFIKVLEASTDETPFGNQKVSQQTMDVMATMLDTPEFRALKGLGTNQVSDIVDTPEGKMIYKVVSVQTSLPTDFATNKEQYRTQAAQKKAGEAFGKLVESALDGNAIEWTNKGYQVLFQLARAYSDQANSATKLKKVEEDALAFLKTAKANEVAPAMYALVLASGPDPMGRPTAQNPDRRIEVIEAILKAGGDDSALRFELVDLYATKKDPAKASQILLDSAKGNTSYDASGQRTFSDIAAKLVQLKANKVLTDDQAKLIEAEQAKWRTSKVDFDKRKKEADAERLKLQKENEAALKRQKEEAGIKDEPAAPKTEKGSLLPPGTVPPTGGAKKQ